MADDKTLRSYRSDDSYRRNTNADAQDMSMTGTDPLAELARLIGQSDPFTDNVRRQPQTAAPRMQDDAGDWRRHIQRPSYDTREEPAFDADPRYATADAHYAAADQQAGYADQGYSDQAQGYSDQLYAAHDPYRMSPQQDHYADPHADYRHDGNYAAGDYQNEQMYAAAPQQGAQGTYAGSQQQDGDDGYDDPPRRRKSRGSSLVTAVVLIGCAMLGTAGAYGYRTYANSPGGSRQAPVIIADNAPNKIVPSADQKSARVQDRVGAGDERLVSREEQPVALPGTSSVPRVVFPSPVQPAPTTTGSTPPSAANAQASGGSVDQPKRIRTVPIRPEGGDTSGRPSVDAPTRTTPPSTARAAPPSAPPSTRASRDQPLSLDPAAPAPAGEAARPQQRPLTPPAPRETAAPSTRVASAPTTNANGNTAGGGYLVQVSSQKSETDAQSSYRALQTKYSQLKSRQPVIRRADLGNKGVFYRAMVGPFDSGDEAVQFCNGLKQAGGQCIIHRN